MLTPSVRDGASLARLAGKSKAACERKHRLRGYSGRRPFITAAGAGVMLDRRYDRGLARYFPFAVLYPLVYWMLMSVISAIYTIDGLVRKRPAVQVWHIQRAGASS